jgi:hypothetical protein
MIAGAALLATACGKIGFRSVDEASFNQSSTGGGTNTTTPPLVCAAGQPTGPKEQYYPTACLVPQVQLNPNSLGLEVNDGWHLPAKTFTIVANDPINGVSQDTALYIEVSTYVYPDTIVISADDGNGHVTELLDICNISTWNKGDITHGLKRPYSDTILQFNVVIPKGTKSLLFDYTNSFSPTYLGVWNLGEFSDDLLNPENNPFITQPQKYSTDEFRIQQSLPSPYNDDADPAQSPNYCPNI